MFEILSNTSASIGGVTFTTASGAKVFNDNRYGAHRGLHLKFTNGFVLSVQWGEGTYSAAGRDRSGPLCSATAEIAVWHEGGTCDEFLGDPLGWVPASDVLALIPCLMGLDPGDRSVYLATMIDHVTGSMPVPA